MTIAFELGVALDTLLDDNEENTQLVDNLDAAQTKDDLEQAWIETIQAVNKKYSLTRSDVSSAKFNLFKDNLERLKTVLEACAADASAQYMVNIRQDLAQLHFRIMNYYSIANEFALCKQWHEKAANYIIACGLSGSKTDAILHQLRGAEFCRQFQAGVLLDQEGKLISEFPKASIVEMQKGLGIYKELGSNLASEDHMRHTQMCLASVMLDRAEWLIKNVGTNEEVESLCHHAVELMNELEPLVQTDAYKLAGVCESRCKANMLNGQFDAALVDIQKAISSMPEVAKGQRVRLYKIKADVGISIAVQNNNIALTLSDCEAENMYVKAAQVSQEQLATHSQAQIATSILNIGTDTDLGCNLGNSLTI